VEAAQKLGVKVMACTGRTWAMCDWLIPTLGFDDYCVTSNGASIVHTQTGENVHRMRLEPHWLPPLFAAAWESGIAFDVFCGPLIHTYAPRRSWWTKNSEERAKTLPPGHGIKLRHFDDYTSWLEATRDVAEIFRIETEPGAHYPEEILRAIDAHNIGRNITTSFEDHYDLCHPLATKANAMDFICRRLGIGLESVMAIGDSNNDTDMIRHAGLGVAMGNGAPEVKAAANVVAPSADEDGFAWAVRRFVLEPKEALPFAAD
jgi:hypothetical protein